jgi:branched-chain amino acid transport system ATP-binding protein
VEETGEVILKMKEEGLSMLVVEQNLPFALKVSDESHVLSKGRIVYSSTPQELWENQAVKSQYLGV